MRRRHQRLIFVFFGTLYWIVFVYQTISLGGKPLESLAYDAPGRVGMQRVDCENDNCNAVKSFRVVALGDAERQATSTPKSCTRRLLETVARRILGDAKVPSRSVYHNARTNVYVYGRIKGGHQYAVFSSSVGNPGAFTYLFLLPLTLLAWQRIGFSGVIFLVVDDKCCDKADLIIYMISVLLRRDATVVMMASHPNNTVMISQTSRLFAASIIDKHSIDNYDKWGNTLLMTSDADIWPLNKTYYVMPPGGAILSQNAFCCGHFRYKGRVYRMMPMTNCMMNQSTWMSVLEREDVSTPRSSAGILSYYVQEFGSSLLSNTDHRKVKNSNWYLDQKMLSIRVWDWINEKHTAGALNLQGKRGIDRITRNHWNTSAITLKGKVDSHVLPFGFQPDSWNKMFPLLKLMHSNRTVKWCVNYLKMFRANVLPFGVKSLHMSAFNV